ncbi:MAG: hypothetical protein ACTHMZ_11940 [Actinomycetes bacterium]
MSRLVAAGVVPSTPLLVPVVAGGSVAELAGLRQAVGHVLQGIADSRADLVVIATNGEQPHLAAFGLDVVEGLPRDVVAWLVQGLVSRGHEGDVMRLALSSAAGAPQLQIAEGVHRVAVLLVGDGSMRHREGGPGGFDDDASTYDADLQAAMTGPLLQLQRVESERGLRQAATVAPLLELLVDSGQYGIGLDGSGLDDSALDGRCLHYEAPYGVGYFAALWTSERRDG